LAQQWITQQWIEDIDESEIALEEMAAATLHKDFTEELAAIEEWFRVCSDAERTASLYAFTQQITQGRRRLFLKVLEQMAR
jgi:hypothetical protein